ncbi:MAG: hypothetical protein H6648_04545 [Caldilineae bacterium]|nr:hypothetical protein [Caldilineae bacterium]
MHSRLRPRAARGHARPGLLVAGAVGLALLASGLRQPLPGATQPERLTLRFEDPPRNLSGSPDSDSDFPRIAVTQAGTVHVVWQEAADNLAGSNLLTRARRDGLWGDTQYLARAAQDPALIAWGEDEAAAAYASARPADGGDGDIAFKIMLNRWDPKAAAWSRRGEAVPTGDGGVQPALGHADGRFWLAWVDTSASLRRPQYAALRDGPTPEPIGDTLSLFDDDVQSPQVAPASDGPGDTDINIAWMNGYGIESNLSHVWLPAAAPTPSVNRALGTYYLYGQPRRPALAATRRQNVCVAWQEAVNNEAGFRQDVIQMCSPWTAPVNVSSSASASGDPSLGLDDDIGSLMLWQERLVPRIDEEIRFLQGAPPHSSTVYSGTVGMPSLAFDPQRRELHAVWVASLPGAAGSDIFYARWKVDSPTPSPSPTPSRTPSRTPSPSPSTTPPTPTMTTPPELTPTPATYTPTPSVTPTTRQTPAAHRLYAPSLRQLAP